MSLQRFHCGLPKFSLFGGENPNEVGWLAGGLSSSQVPFCCCSFCTLCSSLVLQGKCLFLGACATYAAKWLLNSWLDCVAEFLVLRNFSFYGCVG